MSVLQPSKSHNNHLCKWCISDAKDLGGPRREFLTSFLREVRSKLVKEDELINDDVLISSYTNNRLYYFFGLVTGNIT